MRRLIGTIGSMLLISALMTGCAALLAARPQIALPVLHLPPSSLPEPLAEQQQLQFRFGSQQRQMQALLESDAQAVQLAVQAMGQTGVRLRWDGQQLEQHRAAWLPPQVRAARVLDDLQFVFWPESAIAAALPAQWQLQSDKAGRRLIHQGRIWLESTRAEDGSLLLINHAEGYELLIHSVPLEADAGL